MESISFYQKIGHQSFRQTSGSNKWNLRKKYSEPNFDEKEFQLFQTL